MGQRDPGVDAYLANAAGFARTILEQLRAAVHAACPECEETIRWSVPHFQYRGAILCSMAAFKQHATFGFWKGALLDTGDRGQAMGQFGRLTRVSDLPGKRELAGYIRQAMALQDEDAGVKTPKSRDARPRPPAAVPDDLAAALRRNREAQAAFEAFPPGRRREYVEWITEAKRDDTRQKRLARAIEWMAEGKPRNWKYMDC